MKIIKYIWSELDFNVLNKIKLMETINDSFNIFIK